MNVPAASIIAVFCFHWRTTPGPRTSEWLQLLRLHTLRGALETGITPRHYMNCVLMGMYKIFREITPIGSTFIGS